MRFRSSFTTCALAAAAVTGLARDASAGDEAIAAMHALPSPDWYLPVGLNAGITGVGSSRVGAILGAEASVAKLMPDMGWFGAYVDGGYMTAERAVRFSVGPEVGYSLLGLDAGFLDVVAGGRDLVGFTVRPMLTIGLVALYGRWDHTVSFGGGDNGQIGVLLKYPLPLSGQDL